MDLLISMGGLSNLSKGIEFKVKEETRESFMKRYNNDIGLLFQLADINFMDWLK